MTKKESAAHRRYMEKYNQKKHRERLENEANALAKTVTSMQFDWAAFYTKLYTKLGLTEYLPKVLSELRAVEV
jgi:hypothetical protein